jgi:hypothetical protein
VVWCGVVWTIYTYRTTQLMLQNHAMLFYATLNLFTRMVVVVGAYL